MGGCSAKQTYFELHNETNQNITNTQIHSVYGPDWKGARPDYNLHGRQIPAKKSISEREDIKAKSSNCSFNIILTFSDGTVDELRVHQRLASVEYLRKSHDITHYRSGEVTLVVKVKNTLQQLNNEKAEQKNREGQAAMKNQQYETARKLFDEALKLASNGSTVNSIKKNKSEACTQIGKKDLQEGFTLEGQDKSAEAKSKFESAQNMFKEAQGLNNSSAQQQNSKRANLKIEGNNLFNQANDLETAAFTLFEDAKKNNDYTAAQNKYKEALAKYEAAASKFEEGAKLDASFADSVKFTKEVLENVKKVVGEIEQIELKTKISDVHVDEDKQEEETSEIITNTNFKEQVDVATDM